MFQLNINMKVMNKIFHIIFIELGLSDPNAFCTYSSSQLALVSPKGHWAMSRDIQKVPFSRHVA